MIRITAPHFVAGVLLHSVYVTATAPIVRYMLGWDADQVTAYCRCMRWQLEFMS